jgi:hypothetical protein
MYNKSFQKKTYYPRNNHIDNNKTQQKTSYNHVIKNLQDYMLYGKLLVHSLKFRSGDKNKKHKIMTCENKNNETIPIQEVIMKKEKDKFFYPIQKDQLYWCFFIIKNGFSAYEQPDICSFVNEKKEKIKCVDLLRQNKQQLKVKKIKNVKEDVEDELVNREKISMKTFIALCVVCNLNILYIQKRKCFELIFDEDSPIHVVHEMVDGRYCYEHVASKEQTDYYRKAFFKWESIEKPLKAVSSYTADELVVLNEQLGLETTKTTGVIGVSGGGKKKTKNELYQQIIMNI